MKNAGSRERSSKGGSGGGLQLCSAIIAFAAMSGVDFWFPMSEDGQHETRLLPVTVPHGAHGIVAGGAGEKRDPGLSNTSANSSGCIKRVERTQGG